ncbi:signal peptide protein [Rhodopirellula maiorica SM1]|uniref:Signal peptide protein n=1 Tax=Rhodopirellula maiorica SM1 TaxID=1265738 RepID=M5RLK2_9BACT|nr:hypothetical protein [Rhodopirellula maiorica]EMI20208.1 signal peptide protein [Rhodopirellula maiorica SM1]
MRNIIILAMLVAGASAAGWFQIQRDGEYTRIDINRAEIREDARRAIDKGREILDRRDQSRSDYSGDETAAGPSYPPNYDPGSYPAPADPYQSQYQDYGPSTGTGPRYNQAELPRDYPAYDNRPYDTGSYPMTGPAPNYGTTPSTSPYPGQSPADYPPYNSPAPMPRR